MHVIAGVLHLLAGVLLAIVGAFLCYMELFGEQPDWATMIIGVLLLLVGVGCIWTRLIRAIRG